MSIPTLSYTTKEERLQILAQAFDLLENNGVKINSEKARKYYAEAGCVIDGETVKIKKELVEKCIASAPSVIEMYDRNGKNVMHVGKRNAYFGPGPTCPNFFDAYTGERRPSRKEDAAITARLVDALPNIDYAMSLVMISDKTGELADVHEVDAMIRNTTKPIFTWAFYPENCQALIDLAAAAVGGLDVLKEKPYIAIYSEPTTPFVHTWEAIENVIVCAENMVPMIYTPGMIMGATAPVTVAATLTVGLVDSLAGLVLSQLVNPGAPFIGACSGGPMDMKTMQHSYGAPEWVLCHNASTELFHEIDIPVFNGAGVSDSKVVDAQSAFESAIQIISAMATGGNITHDIGFMDLGITGSPVQLVMCDEFVGYARRLFKGFDVDEDHLGKDTIIEVGPGGNFLAEEHTMEFFREIWTPSLISRDNYEGWQKNGGMTLTEAAQKKTIEILNTHTPEPLFEEILAKMDAIVERREQAVAGK